MFGVSRCANIPLAVSSEDSCLSFSASDCDEMDDETDCDEIDGIGFNGVDFNGVGAGTLGDLIIMDGVEIDAVCGTFSDGEEINGVEIDGVGSVAASASIETMDERRERERCDPLSSSNPICPSVSNPPTTLPNRLLIVLDREGCICGTTISECADSETSLGCTSIEDSCSGGTMKSEGVTGSGSGCSSSCGSSKSDS